ncbi:hypothetical protein [Chryseobacterium artocarpi]|uniref:hypothetical protein n=1 Tax=Chryseobacterium artocarpi TaxID=1414727 RepID=UPI003F319B73
MKKILLFILINFITLSFAQESAFIISNKQVVWQHIYESNKNIDEVKQSLLSRGKLKITNIENGLIYGDISDFMMDYKGAGNTLMGTPIYLSSSKFFGNFKIEFKEGKYRVSVTNIRLKGETFSLYSSRAALSSDSNDNLETLILKNDRESFKGSFDGKSSRIINYSLTQLFDISKYTKTDDNC